VPVGFDCQSKQRWTNGYSGCVRQTKDRRACANNLGWTCTGYHLVGWCQNNLVVKKHAFAMGPEFNSPEENCCECGGGSPTTASWSTISSRAACESNSEGIERTYGAKKHTLQSCKTACESMGGCVAIDFYRKTGWCNLFKTRCRHPHKTDSGASSYALDPTFGAAFEDFRDFDFGAQPDEPEELEEPRPGP